MRFLDIDLDAFQHDVLYHRSPDTRPSSSGVPAWSEGEVRDFLEAHCGLSVSAPVRGRLVTNHDELFDLWHRELEQGSLLAPFDVVHVDAHADLGLGDAGYMYLMTELLHVPVEQRASAVRPQHGRGMGSGNYLAFAIGCRWIGSLTYVYPPKGGSDELYSLFRSHHPASGFIEIPLYPPGTTSTPINRPRVEPATVEPAVPYSAIRAAEFNTVEPFDMACVSISPEFTARATERLLPVINDYIRWDG